MKAFLLFVINIILIVESVNSQSFWDNFKNGVNTVSKGVCLATFSPQITTKCLNTFDEVVNKDERDDKVLCCAFLSLKNCTQSIAKEKCGEDGEWVADSYLSGISNYINRGITSNQCIGYTSDKCIGYGFSNNANNHFYRYSTYCLIFSVVYLLFFW